MRKLCPSNKFSKARKVYLKVPRKYMFNFCRNDLSLAFPKVSKTLRMQLQSINAILWVTFQYADSHFKIYIPSSQQKKWQDIPEVKHEVNCKMTVMVIKRKACIWFVEVKSWFVWASQVAAEALHHSHRNTPFCPIFTASDNSATNVDIFYTLKNSSFNLSLKNINIYKLI